MSGIKYKGKLISAVLNNEFIKMMEVTKTSKQIIVHRAVTIPTPKGCVNDGVLNDCDELALRMKEAFKEKGFTSNNICFSVSSTKIATKEVVIPNINPKKIAKLVETNAPDYFPVNINDHIVEYSVIDKINEDGNDKLKIMVAALNDETAKSYYELASKLGMNLLYLDYTGNSAYQLVRHQLDDNVNLVVEIENDGSVVNIFKNNVLKLQRMVPYGKSLLVDAVMSEYKLDYRAALTKLQNEEVLHTEFDGDEVTESIRYLIGNINRIMDYYTSRNKGDEIARAYVLGNATTIKGFNELLSNEIRKEVTNIIDLNNVVCDKKTGFEKRRLHSYLNNVGALIEPVNFIPEEFSNKESSKESFRTYKLLLTGAIFVSLVFIVYPILRGFFLEKTIDDLNTQIKNKKEIVNVVNDYYDAKDAYLDAVSFKSLTVNNNDKLGDLITSLEEKIPVDVNIESMSNLNGNVSISGKASSKESVAKLIKQLNSIKGVSNVVVPSIQESKDSTDTTYVTFSLTFSFANTEDKE